MKKRTFSVSCGLKAFNYLLNYQYKMLKLSYQSDFRILISYLFGRKTMSNKLNPVHRPLPIIMHDLPNNRAEAGHSSPLPISSSRYPTDDSILPREREGSFDKIISRFQSPRHNKENGPGAGNAKTRMGKDSPVITDRGLNRGGNETTCTDRVKNNLAKLRRHYCFLPDISELKRRRPTMEIEMGDDYEKFEKRSGHLGQLASGERRPLGFLKIGKLKYQKSMVFLNQ